MTADRRTLGGHRRAKRQATGTELHVFHTVWPDTLQTGINLLIYKKISSYFTENGVLPQNDQFVSTV